MGAADDFMRSLLESHPELKTGRLSEAQVCKLVSRHQVKINNKGLDDFDGLSPGQMHFLLNAPFETESLISIKRDLDSHLDKVPLFKLLELLLSEIDNTKALKLTAKGNLPVRICELLHSQDLIQWEFIKYVKRISEEDIPYIWPLKQYLLDIGIVKKRNNCLSLTKQGEKFMQAPATLRFDSLLNYFSNQFHWGNFYDLDDSGKCGQLGWAYSLLLVSRYGSQPRESEFYSLKWMSAFEKELWQAHQTGNEKEALVFYHRAYAVRFFECFGNWFGLVKIERRLPGEHIFKELLITKSELFDNILEFKTVGKSGNKA
ncbi:hypothetical protein [Dyadobacter sp. 3J3]|uniref:hypothetical protein n=1 Tax=Dyadobacter sp. 3J3 TaxID=2606600 RepID=UPI00135B29BE|nr:hypothetical protein [Dyadobacter sp. 3J3]